MLKAHLSKDIGQKTANCHLTVPHSCYEQLNSLVKRLPNL